MQRPRGRKDMGRRKRYSKDGVRLEIQDEPEEIGSLLLNLLRVLNFILRAPGRHCISTEAMHYHISHLLF